MKPEISIIICSHNPRLAYIHRVLEALKAQTLTMDMWELLLIDNASDSPLSTQIDLSWHPHAFHIREEQLGLTPARLCGIQKSQSDLLIFVDDDNVLDPDYLEAAFNISKEYPFIGAWGGQIKPEFEELPPEWTKSYWWMLAIREFDTDKWSNLPHCYDTAPCGAGLCIRRNVAQKYVDLLHHDVKRVALDRKGKHLTSCGDLDLVFTACDLGLGTGQFTALKMLHLMPPSRLREDYLLKLAEANGYSSLILESFRGKMPNLLNKSWKSALIRYYSLCRLPQRNRRFLQAFERGKTLAIQEIMSH